MAYDKNELEKQALAAIQEHKLIWIEEVVTYLPCSRSTFYEIELEKSDTIKTAILQNRTDLKVGLRKKWYESENATTQIALYKLIGTDDESDRINSQKVKHDGAVEVEQHVIDYSKLSDDALREILAAGKPVGGSK
jgi:hypothetical protein